MHRQATPAKNAALGSYPGSDQQSDAYRKAVQLVRSAARILNPTMRVGDAWNTLPEGWTSKTREQAFQALTKGNPKHRVTECIKRMHPHVDNPGAFCAAMADRVLGKKWRKRKKKSTKKKAKT